MEKTMKRILITIVIFTLSSSVFAAKWNQVTGDELIALYESSVMTGYAKSTKFTIHNCGGRSFIKFGTNKKKERVQTYPNGEEMCNEDDKGNRCYKIFQNAKKPNKLKYEGTNSSSSGKLSLTDKTPEWCG